MNIKLFIDKLRKEPTAITFADTMAVIDACYDFKPTAFKNGNLENKAGENSGSCKLLAFAKIQGLTKQETLACFGNYYFSHVLQNPEGTDHQNIRNFIKTGFEGLKFDGIPLTFKN